MFPREEGTHERPQDSVLRRDVREQGNVRPPKFLRSTGHPGQRDLGHGKGYVYPHDDPAGFDMSYLPDELEGKQYYKPDG